MSTKNTIINFKNVPYITKQNLSLFLGKTNYNLDYWSKKLVNEGALIPLKNGLYAPRYYYDLVSQSPNEKEKYVEFLANTIRGPSYVSLEYVLSKNNFLAESVFSISSVTLKSTRTYNTDIAKFIYKNMRQDLFYGYYYENFKDKQIKIASVAKALFDFFYLMTIESNIKEYLLNNSRFNWDTLSTAQKKEFEEMAVSSQSHKMLTILKILKQEKIL